MDELLEAKFWHSVDAWKTHCETFKHSSNPNDYLKCDGFLDIILMGHKVLPLLQKAYGRDDTAFFPVLGWAIAVQMITGGHYQVPPHIRRDVMIIRDYTLVWLDENMDRYASR